MLSCMPPRFAHPNGSNHVDGYAVFGRNVFAFLTFLFGVPYVFGLVKSQFFSFAKFVQRVLHVSFSRHILQIFNFVVLFVAVFVVYMALWRARAYKRASHHSVNSLVRMFSIYRQRYKQVPIPSTSGRQNLWLGGLVRCATKDPAYHRLTYAHQRRDFSGATIFTAHLVDKSNFFFRQRSLAKIGGAKTSYSAFVADFIRTIKAGNRLPSLHLKTPIS